ncbi:MAG: glutamate 5-kinase [Chitinophagales bacterium]
MQKLVIKVGTSTLTKGTNRISRGKIEDLARQILVLQERFECVVVSSGAIAAAKQSLELSGSNPIAVKQALAAIGQPNLIRIYQEVFSDFGLKTAQCLLTYQDFRNETSRTNTKNTLNILLQNHFIPIVNENDTVATEEIMFGDNDKLGALTAGLLEADLLVLVSDIDGLYTKDPNHYPDAAFIDVVEDLEKVRHFGGKSKSQQGTGGMYSKLVAAEICLKHGVEMWIVNGTADAFVVKALEGKIPFTRFKALNSESIKINHV